MQTYTDASNQLKSLDMNKDSLFMQRLKSLECWIEETKNHISELNRQYHSGFAWDRLQEMIKTFHNSVQMMRIIEIQRTRRLHAMLNDLTENMHGVETQLGQFGIEEQDDTSRVELDVKRETVEEDMGHAKRQRMS